MKIFAEGELSTALEGHRAALRNEIRSENNNKLLNVNEADYIDYLVEKYSIEELGIYPDRVTVSAAEELIPAEYFPHDFNVYQGKSYPKQVVTYHLPFSGDSELLRRKPSSRIMWSRDVAINGNAITFKIIDWRNDAAAIKQEADHDIKTILNQCANVNTEIHAYNAGLRNFAKQAFDARKSELLKQLDVLSQLGVPVRPAANIPATFSLPTVKKKVLIKPQASGESFKPEPALDESLYREILRICRDAGREMERHPSVYGGKDEETLRDHLIMVLSPHFESVTGETFNRAGKADIVVRHEGANVFVAECKFWRGEKSLLAAIDQVLSYLTWRDSKAAILCFVRGDLISSVASSIPSIVAKHPCYRRTRDTVAEGWYQFDFHLPNDPSRGLSLAVLCFHFPQSNKSKKSTATRRTP
jgi:hypothetical protein